MNTAEAGITAVSAVAVALITAVGLVVVARQNRRAQDKSSEVTQETTELTNWRDLASAYREDSNDLRERVERLESKSKEQDKALREERLRREGMSRELEREHERLTALERRFRLAIGYIQTLLSLLRTHDIQTPPPPTGLDV